MTTIGSRYVDIDGPVHVADLGGEGPPVVCVHGLGGSYANWLAPGGLQDLGRVTAIDLPGFGLTPPAGRASSVAANQRILDRYLRSFGQPITLVGNSMGGAIAIRQAARAPDTVARLILVSPAAPWDFFEAPPDPVVAAFFFAYAVPGLATAVMKWRRHFMDPEEVARMVIDLCTPHPERIDAEVFQRHVEVAEQRQHIPGIDAAFLAAARSVLSTVWRRKAFDRHAAAISAPTLLIQGGADRLVHASAAQRTGRIRPDWQVEILEEVGHIAMLEVPDLFGKLVTSFVEETEAA